MEGRKEREESEMGEETGWSWAPDNRQDRDAFVLAPVQDIDRMVSHSVAINSDRKTRQLSLQVENSTRTSRKIPPSRSQPLVQEGSGCH